MAVVLISDKFTVVSWVTICMCLHAHVPSVTTEVRKLVLVTVPAFSHCNLNAVSSFQPTCGVLIYQNSYRRGLVKLKSIESYSSRTLLDPWSQLQKSSECQGLFSFDSWYWKMASGTLALAIWCCPGNAWQPENWLWKTPFVKEHAEKVPECESGGHILKNWDLRARAAREKQ